MYINRGNHEAKEMNRNYGFEAEAKDKHGEQTYKVFFPFALLDLDSPVDSYSPMCSLHVSHHERSESHP